MIKILGTAIRDCGAVEKGVVVPLSGWLWPALRHGSVTALNFYSPLKGTIQALLCAKATEPGRTHETNSKK